MSIKVKEENLSIFAQGITASVEHTKELDESSYLVVGTFFNTTRYKVTRLDELKYISGIAKHLKGSDYYACLFYSLKSLTLENIEILGDRIRARMVHQEKTKVAFVSGNGQSVMRHIFNLTIQKRLGTLMQEYKANEFYSIEQIAKDVTVNTYKNTGVDIMSDEDLSGVLEAHTWTFAKTALHNPHWYTLAHNWDKPLFDRVYLNIREKGKMEISFGAVYRVFYHEGYRYWTQPDGYHVGTELAKDIILINRSKI